MQHIAHRAGHAVLKEGYPHTRVARSERWEQGLGGTDTSPRLVVETRRHPGPFTSVAWCADGRLIATAGAANDPGVKVWTLHGTLALEMLPADDDVSAIAFSPDGTRLVGGTQDGNVLEWRLDSRRPRRLGTHANGVQSIQFDRTGGRLVTSSLDGTIVVRDGRTGRPRHTLAGNPESAGNFALAPDGRLALADGDAISLVNADTDRRRALSGHGVLVTTLAFDAGGRTLASGDLSGGVRLWRTESGRLTRILIPSTAVDVGPNERPKRAADEVLSMAWSPGGRRLAVGTVGGRVMLWASGSKRPLDVVDAFGLHVWGLCFRPDDRFLVGIGGTERSLKLWHLARDETLVERASVIALGESDWAAVTPDDTYDVSPAGARYLFWVGKKRRPVAIDAMPERRIQGLIPRLLADGEAGLAPERARPSRLPSTSDATVSDATVAVTRWLRETENDDSSLPALTVRTNPAHGVSCVALSENGELVASGSFDMTVHLWDTATGKEIRTLRGHTHIITALAFIEPGLLASGSADGTLRLWDTRTGETVDQLPIGLPGQRVALTRSVDGETLLCTSNDGAIRVIHCGTGRILNSARLLEAHPSGQPYILSEQVAVSPDARIALRPHDRSVVTALELETGRLLYEFGTEDTPGTIRFDPRGRRFAVGGATSRGMVIMGGGGSAPPRPRRTYAIELRRTDTGDLEHVLLGHTANVMALAFSPRGDLLASGSEDGTIRVWAVRSGQCRGCITSGSGAVLALAFDSDAATVTSGESTPPYAGRLTRWDLATESPRMRFERPAGDVNPVCFSPNGRLVAAGGEDGLVRVWSLDGEAAPRLFAGHTARVFSLDFSPDGRRLASAAWDGTSHLWDVASGAMIAQLDADANQRLWNAKFSADGRWLTTSRHDGTVSVWDAASGSLERAFEWAPAHAQRGYPWSDVAGSALGGVFSPDGATLAVAYGDGRVALWDVVTRRRAHTFHAHDRGAYSVAFHPDGSLFATGGFDQTVAIWRTNGRLARRLQGHGKPGHIEKGTSVAFSPDGRVLASGGTDGTIRLWDVATGDALAVAEGHRGAVASIAFDPTGSTLAAASNDASVSLWDVRSPERPARRCVLYAFTDRSWAVIDAQGRYDASAGGDIEWLHWVVGHDIVALHQLKERYYEPGLLAKTFGFGDDALRDVPTLAGVRLYPDVHVLAASGDGTRSRVRVVDRGGGIGRVEVFLNGKEVRADARGDAVDPNAGSHDIEVDLTDHPFLTENAPNTCLVRAYNAEGYLVGRGVSWTVTSPVRRRPEPPHLWAIVAGVSGYAAPTLALRFAAKDAEDVAAAVQLAGSALFGPERVHVRLLASPYRSASRETTGNDGSKAARPTRSQLAAAFAEAQAAASSDVLLVYLAGHGVSQGGPDADYFYLTADARTSDLTDPGVRDATAVSSRELTDWMRAIPALKQVLVLDTCAAGRFVDRLSDHRAVPSSHQRAFERMKDRTGMHVLAGSTADAVSYESSQYGQGILTYSLLLGMRGAALRDDEFVDVGRLFGFATDSVPRLAAFIGGIQRPIMATPRGGASFDIGRVSGDARSAIPAATMRPLVMRAEFEETTTWHDSQGLGRAVNELLRDRSARGRDAPLIFIDTADVPDAYRVRGRYVTTGGSIDVDIRVMFGAQPVLASTFTATPDASDALAATIVDGAITAIHEHFGGTRAPA